jgi:hypothetical protein
MKSRVSVTFIGLMAAVLLGGLVFAPTPASARKFKDRNVSGRYVCQVRGVDSDIDAALVRFGADGHGSFTGGSAVEEDELNCPYALCTGTSCGSCTFTDPSSYTVNPDGTGTTTENWFSTDCSICFTSHSVIYLNKKNEFGRSGGFKILEDSFFDSGDEIGSGVCTR